MGLASRRMMMMILTVCTVGAAASAPFATSGGRLRHRTQLRKQPEGFRRPRHHHR
jgi:hypothetical protein